jgi:pyrophosphate--fructose-6-phosphate 1-phosphotransferase
MPESSTIGLNQLLDHPAVADAVADVNMELKERVAYQPPVCEVFNNPFTCLVPDTTYQFEIDKDAHRQLSHIIDNTVQRSRGQPTMPRTSRQGRIIAGRETSASSFQADLLPADTTSSPACSMRPNKSTHDTRIFGFLMGPDGIIDGDYMELTRDLVDRYRNVGGFTMIKTGRTKIDNRKKMSLSRETCKQLEPGRPGGGGRR